MSNGLGVADGNLKSEANGVTCTVASTYPLCDASDIAPHHHHVLPPDCVSSQVDRDSGAFYSTELSKTCRFEYRQSAAKCRQDPVLPVLMAPRSDSLVTSVIPATDFQWSFLDSP
jgi:hypothetical protein